jgi:hypothetical protein
MKTKVRHGIIFKHCAMIGLLMILILCVCAKPPLWRTPAALPPSSFEGYKAGPIFKISAKTLEEAQRRVLRADSVAGFLHIYECTTSNVWKCYTEFKNMEGLIAGLPHHEVVASLLFTVSPLREGFEVQINHRIAFSRKRGQDWIETPEPALHGQVMKYLEQYQGLLNPPRSSP